MTHTIFVEDAGCHIYEVGCRNTRTEADEAAAAYNRDPTRRGQFFVLTADGSGRRVVFPHRPGGRVAQ